MLHVFIDSRIVFINPEDFLQLFIYHLNCQYFTLFLLIYLQILHIFLYFQPIHQNFQTYYFQKMNHEFKKLHIPLH